MGRVRRQWVNRGAGFALGPSWLGHHSPVAEPARDAGTGTAYCPLSGSAGNSGTTDDRSPNAGIILIKPPAQRRMGVKRRLVDQGARTHPSVSAVLLLHDTAHLRHRYREIRPVTDLDARLPMHGAKNLNPVITLKNLLPPGRGPMLRDGPALAIVVLTGWQDRRGLQRQKRRAASAVPNMTGTQPGDQPEKPDHALKPTPGWGMSGHR